MIHISDKSQCCGCEACVQVCPKHCIRFMRDHEGFFYPEAESDTCIQCGLCEKVCPVLHPAESSEPLHVYAAKNRKDKELLESSSGGLFCLIAKEVIKSGGVVFGARFNEKWEVEHDYAETEDGLKPFMGSKYVQSRIGNCYKKTKDFLAQGRKVLFTGTPCQIAGLKNFLRKEDDNLLTVDVLCHGVPSPAMWQQYLEEIKESARKGENTVSLPFNPPISGCDTLAGGRDVEIESIAFRDKRLGWKKYSFALTLAEVTADGKKNTVSFSHVYRDNPYMKGMLNNLFTRPICYKCPFRCQKSKSDLSLGDFWEIENKDSRFADDKGTSMVLINNENGLQIWDSICENIVFAKKSYPDAIDICSMIMKPVPMNQNRSLFFSLLSSNNSFHKSINKVIPSHKSLRSLIKQFIMRRKIIVDAPGQTCNRFWSYLDTIAWAIINKKKVYILWWDPNIRLYHNLLSNPYVSFPFYSEKITKCWEDNKYQRFLKKFFLNRPLRKLYKNKGIKKMGIINGWDFRASHLYYPRVADIVKKIFCPDDYIRKSVESDFMSLRQKGYFIIGVHMRGGDYKIWEGGRYYYTSEEYINVMKKLLAVHHDKKVCFFISTNEKIDRSAFKGLDVCPMQYTTAAHDLYALSHCDRIVGPLSTFSRWASFYGNVPLMFMDRTKENFTDEDFSVITDFYHFENGMEIPNLTDRLNK